MNDTLAFLQSVPPFAWLPTDTLAEAAAQVDEQIAAPGSVILTQGGTPSRYLYLVRAGSVQIERDDQPVMVLDAGELFGHPSLLSGSPTATVRAPATTHLLRLPDAAFRRLLDHPRFAHFFLQSLSERLRQSTPHERSALGGDLTRPIGQLATRAPLWIEPHATIIEAAEAMRDAPASAALVAATPPGILTDRDLRVRILAEGRSPVTTTVGEVMSWPLKSLPASAPIYAALLTMLEQGIHHLPLTDEGGKLVALVSQRDVLRHQVSSPLTLLPYLESLDDRLALARYGPAIAGFVASLRHGGMDVLQIARMVATLNDMLTRRLLELVEAELGPPPCAYAWLALGSEGRREQMLLTDQDNALVYERESPEARLYFEQLTARMGQALGDAGFPPCAGGYMATNWHAPLAVWQQRFERWVHEPEPQALLEAAIFFDYRIVHGALSLDPLDEILVRAGQRPLFLGHLARAALAFRPPLGWLHRIKEEEGHVDLKKGGIAPIVALARVYALAAQGRARATLDRLDEAAAAHTLSREGADTLAESFRFLLALRLRDQLADHAAGRTPDNRVRLDDQLSALERRHLKEIFVALHELQSATAHRFLTDQLA